MNIVPFNFQKPGRLTGPLEQRVSGWCRTASALATRRWHKELPGELGLASKGLDVLTAGDALAALTDDLMAYRMILQPGWISFMAWPRSLALGLIGVLQGQLDGVLPPDRELSPVDDSLFEFFLRDFLLPPFVETWTGRQAFRPEIGDKEPLPRWSRVFTPDELVVAADFHLSGPFGDHALRWLMPRRGLLANFQEQGPEEKKSESKQHLEAAVRELPLEIVVTLGSVQLHLSKLAQLRVGDVVILDQRVSQPLTAQLAGLEKMRGWPGRLGNRQAFQIEHMER